MVVRLKIGARSQDPLILDESGTLFVSLIQSRLRRITFTFHSTYFEPPAINTASKTFKAVVVEISFTNNASQQLLIQYLPTPSMWHPAYDVFILWIRYN